MKPNSLRAIIFLSFVILLSGCGPSKNSIAYKNNGLPEDQSSVLHYWNPGVRIKVIDGEPDDYKSYSKIYLTPGTHKIEGSLFDYRDVYHETTNKVKTYQVSAEINHNFRFEAGKHYHIVYDVDTTLKDITFYLKERE